MPDTAAARPDEPGVAIVGGGWAGLAAAVELAARHIPVQLFEAGPVLGGRARRVDARGLRIDNGQHLLLGAYSGVLALLQRLDVPASSVLRRLPLELDWHARNGRGLRLKAAPLPAPLHLLWGLVTCRGLGTRQRLLAIRAAMAMARGDPGAGSDQALGGWLAAHGQDHDLVQRLWSPLCVAALNTPVDTASTRIFQQVMRHAFGHRRHDADLLLPSGDLGDVLPDPAFAYIRRRGGIVHTGSRVRELLVDGTRLLGLRTEHGTLRASRVILATPPDATRRLVGGVVALRGLSDRLARFSYQPICTVYLQYPESVRLGRDMRGLLDSYGQWVFDHAANGRPGLMAVVISASGPHLQMDNDALARRIHSELGAVIPALPAFIAARVIREKRATFACTVEAQRHRPGPVSDVAQLWLAGDYTDTGFPGTLEGAVRSGVRCAELAATAYTGDRTTMNRNSR